MDLPRKAMLSALTAAALAGSTAGAQTARKVKWERLPGREDVVRATPEKATLDGVGGRARVHCAVAADGALHGCRAKSETPAGYGFGDAAVQLAGKMRLATDQDLPARIVVPVRFPDPPEFREVVVREKAGRLRPSGLVVSECWVTPRGGLRSCNVLVEQPAGRGLKEGFLQMTERRRITAAPHDSEHAELARIKMRFEARP